MTDCCFLIGISITIVATLCSILALSLDYWEVGAIDSEGVGPILLNYVHLQAGLWYEYRTFHDFAKTIIPSGLGNTTKVWRQIDFSTETGMMLFATRLLLFLAVFSLVAASICSILRYAVYQNMKNLMNSAWALLIEAGLLMLICFVLYLTGIKEKTTELHAAFYLDIVAWLLAWFGALFLFMSSRTFLALMTEDPDQPSELI